MAYEIVSKVPVDKPSNYVGDGYEDNIRYEVDSFLADNPTLLVEGYLRINVNDDGYLVFEYSDTP